MPLEAAELRPGDPVEVPASAQPVGSGPELPFSAPVVSPACVYEAFSLGCRPLDVCVCVCAGMYLKTDWECLAEQREPTSFALGIQEETPRPSVCHPHVTAWRVLPFREWPFGLICLLGAVFRPGLA